MNCSMLYLEEQTVQVCISSSFWLQTDKEETLCVYDQAIFTVGFYGSVDKTFFHICAKKRER